MEKQTEKQAIAECRREIALSEKAEAASKRCAGAALTKEAEARRHRLRAANLMASLVAGGMPTMKVYEAVGISPENGKRYLVLAELWSGLHEDRRSKLESEGRFLSLAQAEALKAIKANPQKVARAAEAQTDPSRILPRKKKPKPTPPDPSFEMRPERREGTHTIHVSADAAKIQAVLIELSNRPDLVALVRAGLLIVAEQQKVLSGLAPGSVANDKEGAA